MLEAEISPNGELTVEGHVVGTMQGFRFTADQSADGEDAKAVRAAAQKALAPEFEARATRFAAAANGDLALGADNFVRWLGSPVAVLAAGPSLLAPRVILLADEQLTGPARDKVAARAERYVSFQIDTHLKPLVQLSGDETLSGVAKGIAYRLVEACGIINRREIADDVRSLDQDARAGLRRNGVRFGAYHLFVPALLKPAPAGLLTQLWALQNDSTEKPGYGDIVSSLASGRTSLVTDPAYERTFYKLAGYRLLGKRAVRVDILERLADLIRPALFWKPGIGARPEGGYDGNRFVVTPAMMSILGATAEDMEEILKSLGYKAEPAKAGDVSAHLAEMDAKVPSQDGPGTAETPTASTGDGDTEAEDNKLEAVTAIASDQPTATSDAPDVAGAPAISSAVAQPEDNGAQDETAEPTPAAVPAETGSAGDTKTEPAADEEEKPVLLWRQGRSGKRPERPKGVQRRDEKGDGQRKRGNRPGKHKGAAHGAGQKGGKPDNARQAFEPRKQKNDRIDPNSPFAKLAALKEQFKD